MPGIVCSSPPPPTSTSTPNMPSSVTTTTSIEVSWRSPDANDTVPPWPDSESGIEDSPDSVDGGNMPLSPPIPIPSPRRSSLQPYRNSVSPPTEVEDTPHPTSVSAPASAHEDDTPPPPTLKATPPTAPEVPEDPEPHEEGADEGVCEVPTIQINEETCPADTGIDESSVPPVPKSSGGGDSETSEFVGTESHQPPRVPSTPIKSPQNHTPLNSTPQPKDDIPTDMSDTTESEPESKITCLSSGESVACPNQSSHHQGHVVASPWQSNPETNQKLRQVTYTLTLPPNSFGPKVSHVTETQVVSQFSKHGEIYTVDAEACNAGIPYADSFFVSNHWCLTRESATETRISVWSQVKYKKNVWGFMKGVIDKNAYNGVENLLNDINAALLAEVDRTNLKRTRRRRRRVGSKGEPPDVLLPSQVYPDKVKDIHKSTQMPARKLTLPTVTPDNTISSNEGPVRLVVATLVILLTLNALLYYKLWALEEKMFLRSSPYPTLDPSMFRSGTVGGPLEEWVRILQQQEAIHAAEVERWRKSIEEAAGFLRKLLLRQIQNLHEAESQRRSSAATSEPLHRDQEATLVDPTIGPDIPDHDSDSVYKNTHENEVHVDL
ncbi:Aster-B-like 3, partial [Homarus americanus]